MSEIKEVSSRLVKGPNGLVLQKVYGDDGTATLGPGLFTVSNTDEDLS